MSPFSSWKGTSYRKGSNRLSQTGGAGRQSRHAPCSLYARGNAGGDGDRETGEAVKRVSDGAGHRRWGLQRLFVVVYLVVQITVPVAGLYLAHQADEPMRFSWHMFSRVRDGVVDD